MATASFDLDDFGAEPLPSIPKVCRKGMPHARPCGPIPGYDDMCACGCAADETYCLYTET